MIEKALINNAKKTPNKIAIICGTKKITFRELINLIYSYSSYLSEIKKKQQIILNFKNSIDWVVYYFSIRFSGHIPVLISNFMPSSKVKFIINNNKIKYIICDNKIKLSKIRYLNSLESVKKKKIKKKNIKSTKKRCEIIYTSGTTGDPKGVKLSLDKSLIVAKMINKIVKLQSKTKELIALPLNHSDGLGRLKCFAINGHTLILNENPYNFGYLFTLLENHEVNGFFMVPSGIEILKKMNFLDFKKISNNLKFIELGSEKINSKTLSWVRTTFKKTVIYYHYGLTEASRSAFKIIKYGKKIPQFYKASPGVKIKILNKQDRVCKKNEIGEIVIEGRTVADGYANNQFKNKFTNFGFKTGDLAKFYYKNKFILLGRVDNVKKINGLSVNLKEVEKEINKHPDIKKNICKFVISTSSNSYEIKTKYISKKKIDEKRLQNFLKNRLEYFKIPKSFVHTRV
jgi:long-chain acyl-CoA synthetase